MAFLYAIQGQEYSRAVIFTTFFIIYVFWEFSHGMLRKLQNVLTGKKIIGFNTLIIGTNQWTFKFSQRISYVFGGFFHCLLPSDDAVGFGETKLRFQEPFGVIQQFRQAKSSLDT